MSTRVLLVDDKAVVRRQLKVALAEQGYDASESPDGLAALRIIERQAREGVPFHIVIVDAILPDMDGLKLLSIVKSRYPDLKVILIAGQPQADLAEQLALRQGDGFLTRPFELERLTAMIEPFRFQSETPTDLEAGTAASRSAYLFVKVAPSADPLQVYQDLGREPTVVTCDAVRDNHTDLVLLLKGRSHEALESELGRRLDGDAAVARHRLVPLVPPHLPEDLRGFIDDYVRERAGDVMTHRTPERATTYLVVDTHATDLVDLYTRLFFLDEVVGIEAAASGDQLVLLLQGPDFGHIRRLINERIRLMDGVVRVHELKVVSFEPM